MESNENEKSAGAMLMSSLTNTDELFGEFDEEVAESQRKRILKFMKNFGGITTKEATVILHIMSPRKRLSEINRRIPLIKMKQTDITMLRNGKKKTTRYILYKLPSEN